MNNALDYSDTHREPGRTRAWIFSVLMHAMLAALLVWGVRIQSETPAAIEAELWSALPQIAAPKPVEATPTPPLPKVVKKPLPEPVPEPPAPLKTPEIALEKKPAPKPKEVPKPPVPVPPRTEPKPDQSRQRQEALKENFEREQKRLLEFAGVSSNNPSGTGIANTTSSPRGDASWIARAAARIKSNTVFNADGITSNPSVEFEVQLDPAGYVVKIAKRRASGVAGFDEAVDRAIRKSEPYGADASGKVPPSFVFTHKVRE